MVYAIDSKSVAERLEGSSPSSGTQVEAKKPKIIVVLGPTSSGKTALSVELAKKHNGEIVSADSRQVYRGMNLGTGKVAKKEMCGIPHHLLDVVSPKKVFTVSEYAELAKKAINDIVSRGKVPIVCGGTGFYIDTLTRGTVLPEVPPNLTLRKKLEKKSVSQLFTMLEKLDKRRAESIDKNNPVRLVRAIEIATALGEVPLLSKNEAPYETLRIGLDMPDSILQSRIALRLKERLKAGMLREARGLHKKGVSWRRMGQFGLEYRAMADYLTGKIERKEFEENLTRDIWSYAKRQRVWWKRDTTIHWLDSSKKTAQKNAQSLVLEFLNRKS